MPRAEEQTSRAHVIAALAGVAMHAILARPIAPGHLPEVSGTVAEKSVNYAEALLAEIERRHGGPL